MQPLVAALASLHISPIFISCNTSFFIFTEAEQQLFPPPPHTLPQRSGCRASLQTLILCPGGDCSWPLLGFIIVMNALLHCRWPVREFSSPHYLSASPPYPPLALLSTSSYLILTYNAHGHLHCQTHSLHSLLRVLEYICIHLDEAKANTAKSSRMEFTFSSYKL